jgi:hypothetical protein
MLTELAHVLRAAGLTVVEEPGWRQRGHGPMTNVLGVTCHHTANGGAAGLEPSRAVIRDGRPGLSGPLAHLLLRKDGVYRVIAAGLCYHAGVSRSAGYTNSHRIGIEAEAKGVPGTSGDWPDAQMAAYRLGCKALMKHYGFGLSQVLGHKETCAPAGRKSDPSFDMDDFREATRRATAADLEDDMEWDDKFKVSATDAKYYGIKAGELRTVSAFVRYPPGIERLRKELAARDKAAAAQIAALTATISELAKVISSGSSLTPAQITASAQAGAAAALDAMEVLEITETIDVSDALIVPEARDGARS